MNEPIKTENTDIMSIYQKSENILTDIKNIIESSRRQAYHSVDTILSRRNWLIGYRIAEEEIDGSDRAEYGANIITKLSKELTAQYGKGYDRSNLYHCLRFYKEFPQIVDTVCRQSYIRLSWSHYRVLLQVADSTARSWYEKEAHEQSWSVRTLQRNINAQYYYRLLQSQHKDLVVQEMLEKTAEFQKDKLEFIKNPVIAEFLGLSSNTDFTETDEDIARYSILHGNEQLFASKYKLYLPTEEELRKEIEIQKNMFYLQLKEKQSEQMYREAKD
ncbi:MAG: DUF1016 domain-containing protein [Lachnospiraceae bacterium]|nr:DUF1016 domain-containing protein [Lachnospiraceae bacterium]